jgi:hypothetical protein
MFRKVVDAWTGEYEVFTNSGTVYKMFGGVILCTTMCRYNLYDVQLGIIKTRLPKPPDTRVESD